MVKQVHLSLVFSMFQRQSREPFPARNIIVLAAIVLAALLYVLNSMKEKPAPPPPPSTTVPAPELDTTGGNR